MMILPAIKQTVRSTAKDISKTFRVPKKFVSKSGQSFSLEKNAPFWRRGGSAKDLVKDAVNETKDTLNRVAISPGSTVQRAAGDMIEKPISTAVGVANPLSVPVPASETLSTGIKNPEITLQKNLGIRKPIKQAADSMRNGKAVNSNSKVQRILGKTGNFIKNGTNAGANYFNMLSGGSIMPFV